MVNQWQAASIVQPVAAQFQLPDNQLVGIVQSVIAQFSPPPEKLMESLLNHPNGIKDQGAKSNSVEDGKFKGKQAYRQFNEVIILRIIRFCANIQLSLSDPITKLVYCRGDFFCHPDNLVEIDVLPMSNIPFCPKI